MTETTLIQTLGANVPSAVLILVMAMLFLKRQKEDRASITKDTKDAMEARQKSETALLKLYEISNRQQEANLLVMNSLLEVMGSVKEVIGKCKGQGSTISVGGDHSSRD